MHFHAFIIPFIMFVVLGLLMPIVISGQADSSRINNH